MNLVTAHRPVTLTGAGIGKTRLGLEVARRLLPTFPDGIFLADLAPLAGPESVPVTVTTALNLTLVPDAVSPDGIGAAVATKRLWLVLDNCEHLLEAAARMAQALLRASPEAVLLATSHEPLRADGEYVYRVPPLAMPAEDADAEDILRHDAVRLFVTRARTRESRASSRTPASHRPLPRSVAASTECRSRSSLPQRAFPRSASRASRPASMTGSRCYRAAIGPRCHATRHCARRSTLDWSYELLSERERVVLQRPAVLA